MHISYASERERENGKYLKRERKRESNVVEDTLAIQRHKQTNTQTNRGGE